MEMTHEKRMFLVFVLPLAIGFVVASCTLAFQNISTHGVAEDLVDEELTPEITTDVKADFP
jgi:hypothetical protein